jgi:hypothetical protein
MGVDQLVTGGDVNDPVVDSITSDSIITGNLQAAGPINDETQNRTFGTWYQNTSESDLYVRVFGVTEDTDTHTQILDVNDEQTGREVDKTTVNPSAAGEIYTLDAVVPVGNYYRYRSNEGFFAIDTWLEQ